MEKTPKSKYRINLIIAVVLTLGLYGVSGYYIYRCNVVCQNSECEDCTDADCTDCEKRVDNLEDETADLESEIELRDEQIEDLVHESDKAAVNLPETVIMSVSGYKQTHPASCEAASTHSVMKYFGVNVPENQIISEIGADLSSRYFDDDGKLHWGNPQEKFVGNIDGAEVYVDGYGVYNKPVMKVLSAHGFSKSVSKTGWSIAELISYIRRGYPAIVWVSSDYSAKEVGVMVSRDGVENPWILGEHAVVVRGVDSDKIYIMDVGNGSYYTVSYSKFETGFKNLNNMGIVVIPN